tara:strand:+ start:317 stop:541 length:225 start_codon:yes stop_codon:yes gene_type:complete
MIIPQNLQKGQKLQIELRKVNDRLPSDVLEKLSAYPYGIWMGEYKMVDGNAFGLILELFDGSKMWFFEEELSEE